MKLPVYRMRVAMLPVLLFVNTALADTITWDGGGDGTNWHDEMNWSGDVLPGPGDDAVIGAATTVVVSFATGDQVVNSVDCVGTLQVTGGSLTLASPSAVEMLTMSGGAIHGAADLTVDGLMTWSAGTIDGTGTFFANGGIELSSTGFKILDRRLESIATTSWLAGRFYIDPDGRFVNMPGVLFDVQTDNIMWFSSVDFGTFENRGTFRKSAGTGATDIRVTFDNQGSVDIQTGTVLFRTDSTHTGSVTGPGVARFNVGVHALEASSNVTSPVYVELGTVNVFGTFDVPSLTIANSCTLDVDATTTLDVDAYSQSGGTLTGGGDLTVTGLMTWSAGTIEGTGEVFANGGIELSSTGFKILDRRLESIATTSWLAGRFYIDPDGRFVNMPGVLFDVQTDNIMWFSSVDFGTFENRGTFRKSAGTGATDIRVTFDNQGSVDIQTGTVLFRTDSTHTGSVTGPGVARFNVGVHALEASSNVTSPVYVEFGTVNVFGTFDVPSLTIANSCTLDVDATTTLDVDAYSQSGGTLTGGGDLTVTGLMTWSAGTIEGTGEVFANGGIELSSTGFKILDRRLESIATTTWLAGRFYIDPDGRFVNMPGALFDAQTDNIMWFSSVDFGTFENRGTFRKSAGAGATDIRVTFVNTGTVEVLTGKMISREGYTQTAGATRVDTELEFDTDTQLDLLGGVLLGTGLVDGLVNNDGGTIEPGLSPGTLSVEGDVDQSVFGALVVELGGSKPGEFDVLAIDGDAFLGGLLEIRRFEGYIPPVGEFFTILTTTGSRIGIFDVTVCEDFFLIDYLDQGVRLEVLAELSPADLNQDCSVGFADLQMLLQAWGPCSPPPPAFCPADLNDDDGVGFADLQILLQQWG